MSAKHTPGPWAVGGTHGHQYVRITADNHHKIVGTVRDCEMDGLDSHGMHRWVQTEEGRANARLIAAAPELLALAEEVLASFAVSFRDQDLRARLQAAVDAAKGGA